MVLTKWKWWKCVIYSAIQTIFKKLGNQRNWYRNKTNKPNKTKKTKQKKYLRRPIKKIKKKIVFKSSTGTRKKAENFTSLVKKLAVSCPAYIAYTETRVSVKEVNLSNGWEICVHVQLRVCACVRLTILRRTHIKNHTNQIRKFCFRVTCKRFLIRPACFVVVVCLFLFIFLHCVVEFSVFNSSFFFCWEYIYKFLFNS